MPAVCVFFFKSLCIFPFLSEIIHVLQWVILWPAAIKLGICLMQPTPHNTHRYQCTMIYTGHFYLCLCICIANDDHHDDPLGSQQSSLIVLFLIGNVGQNQVGHTNVPIYDFLLRSVVFNTNDQ